MAYWYHSIALQGYMEELAKHRKSVVGLVWDFGTLNSQVCHVEEENGEDRWTAGKVMAIVGCNCCCFSPGCSSGG